jgi:hypothetical protein
MFAWPSLHDDLNIMQLLAELLRQFVEHARRFLSYFFGIQC